MKPSHSGTKHALLKLQRQKTTFPLVTAPSNSSWKVATKQKIAFFPLLPLNIQDDLTPGKTEKKRKWDEIYKGKSLALRASTNLG